MIDVFIDDVKCESINTVREGYRINIKNERQESLTLVLSEENFIDLYNRIKRRCETQGLVPIYGERREGE